MPYKIEHRIGIQASHEVIWDILADVPGWESWNPLYPQASGVIRIGETLRLVQALPGQKPETITPRIIDWVPYEQLHWANTAGSGLVKSLRYIEIEKLGDDACIFSNGEIFSGWLGPMVAKLMRRSFRAGFTAFSEAMKAKAEAAQALVAKPKAKRRAKAAPQPAPGGQAPLKPVEPLKPMVAFAKPRKLKSS
jgi:hypothetical protein